MSANDRYASLGAETSYGTAVAATRSYEDTGDDWQVVASPVQVGETTRAAQQTDLAHNYQQTLEKVTGSLNTAVYNNGVGLLFANLLGEATTPAAVTSTSNNRYGRNYRSEAAGDTTSFTVRRGRSSRTANWESEAIEEFIYSGCVISGFELSVAANNPWMLKVNFEGQSETPGGSAVAQLYPPIGTGASLVRFFSWQNTSVSVGGATLDKFGGFTLTGNFNLDTAIKPLNSSSNIAKPLRQGLATLEGTLSAGVYSADVKTAVYDRFRSGELASIVVEAKMDPTSGITDDHSRDIFRVTLAQCRFTGTTPSGAPGSKTMLEGPYKVFWDGSSTSHAVDIYLQNAERTDS